MNQIDLALTDRPAPHQRGSDTSRAAARSVRGIAPSRRVAVLGFLKGRGPTGATNEEIAEALGLKIQTVCPRVNELAAQTPPAVVDSGKRRKTLAGRNAVVWVAA